MKKDYDIMHTCRAYMRSVLSLLLVSAFTLTLSACSVQKMPDGGQATEGPVTEKPQATADPTPSPGPDYLVYYDADGNRFEMVIDKRVGMHPYNWDYMMHEAGSRKLIETYDDGVFTIRHGVDVSHHNGKINWKKAKKAGVSFAFLRLGYRGYGKEGKLCIDREFHRNFKNARAAEIPIGVYFFSQAINEKEAVEEAKLVLKELDGAKLELPVVYDPEVIREEGIEYARMNDITKEQFTKNTIAFCEKIKKAGYEPAFYTNLYSEDHLYDLYQLEDYRIWYADYKPEPQTPYRFTWWQYSEAGTVDGIPGQADLDVEFIKR